MTEKIGTKIDYVDVKILSYIMDNKVSKCTSYRISEHTNISRSKIRSRICNLLDEDILVKEEHDNAKGNVYKIKPEKQEFLSSLIPVLHQKFSKLIIELNS